MLALNIRDDRGNGRVLFFSYIGMFFSLFYIYFGLEQMKSFLKFCLFLDKIFPPYVEIIFTIFLFSTVGIYGILVSDNKNFIVNLLESITCFSIDKVRIVGNVETTELDIIRSLDLNRYKSLISFDAVIVQKNLLELPWVLQAAIRRVYPDTIEIRIMERFPYVIWQTDSNLFLIDKNGDIIKPFDDVKFSNLPKLIGHGANKEIKSFEKIKEFSKLSKLVRAYIWVAERRWDLHLENGMIVKFPEEGFNDALLRLINLQDKYKILDKDISVIDMRLPDRIAIRLTIESLRDHQALAEFRKKILDRRRG
ncbi:cell division protein FtsQ/DivIB [Candidatus Liberibacter americanus]|uniref:Cell division protein FtsQ n=1 Tax=Candidatus Liberibacter americanus str. Sao Paulo TaxID=1261131 RepID=U6B7X4_9HYPH|nr:cell division protein FtsQ/DivIB [Candidatus Liberibacter americanus]AHA27961.1 Cell division protein FtsQ [Candidatus Liberibacter americanus str. Sao Paulo]EMS35863.1 cell division protein [Candidatus Liberibacter americanus PW_SP]